MMRRIVTILSLAAAALVFAAAASAAPSPVYQLGGIETAVPQGNVSPFAGLALGSTGDRATWQASVEHAALSGCTTLGTTCAITGGTFTLTSNNGSQLAGNFMSGAITPTSQAPGCSRQQFAVTGSLWTDTGPQDFAGVLTHYRFPFRGQCRTIAATVQGTLTQSIGTF
jgi:hypothetical protein